MGDAAPELDHDRELPESQEEVREASMRLPARQREALALCEVKGLSYDEIAAIMEVNRHTVALLISRGRINLVDELRGTALASAAPSPECERALPLIAMRDDGQLEAASRDAAWLDDHLAGCERCRIGVEVMQEGGASYRTGAPIESTPGIPSPLLSGPRRSKPPRRRVTALAAGLATLLLLAGIATVLTGDEPPATPADTASKPSIGALKDDAKPAKAGKKNGNAAEKKTQTQKPTAQTTAGETIPISGPTPTGSSAPSKPQPNRSPGKAAIKPTQQTSVPKAKSKPAPAPPAQPASVPTTPAAEEAPSSPREPPRGNKPPDHPSSNRNS